MLIIIKPPLINLMSLKFLFLTLLKNKGIKITQLAVIKTIQDVGFDVRLNIVK